MREKEEWCYCINTQNYHSGEYNSDTFDSKEECIKEALEEAKIYIDRAKLHSVYIAKCERVKVEQLFKIEDILEQIGEHCYEEYGEYAENYNDELQSIKPTAIKEANDFLHGWAKKHNLEPSFWTVYGEEQILTP